MDCYYCGQEGHRRSECPARSPAPAASDPSGSAEIIKFPAPLPRRYRPAPPDSGYFEAREAIGMPSHAAHIAVGCPWCGARPLAQCINVGTGKPTAPHDARLKEAGEERRPDPRWAVLARRQAAEARAERLADIT